MCLILLAYRAHPRIRLLVAANRDEWRDRPTAQAAWWDDAPGVLAGRDLRRMGTWMGIARDGRWAALTNIRGDAASRADGPSRGALVADYLRGADSAEAYLSRIIPRLDQWDGFNLLVGDAKGIRYVSNGEGEEERLLQPGVYGLSNAPLGTEWPKTRRGVSALRELLAKRQDPGDRAVFRVLADVEPAPDDALPDTGVGKDWERALSPMFIDTPDYGTRASSVLRILADGTIRLVERSFGPGRTTLSEIAHRFSVPPISMRPQGTRRS